MRNSSVRWAIVCAALGAGCTGQVGSGGDMEGDEGATIVGTSEAVVDLELGHIQLEAPDEALMVQNRLVREAIFQGNALASEALERIVTSTLGGFGLDATYVEVPLTADSAPEGTLFGSDVIEAEPAIGAPLATVGAACAYARPSNDATQMGCRFVLNRATSRGFDEIVQDVQDHPLAEDMLEDALDRNQVLDWYAESANFGIENTTQVLDALRVGQVCDQAPTVVEAAFEVGARLGRNAMNAQTTAVAAITPRTECNVDSGIVQPAYVRALAAVPALVDRNPLCTNAGGGEFVPASGLEGANYAANLEQLRAGIFAGIDEQRPVESARMVRTWVCTPPAAPAPAFAGFGDPLVLDLDGDGVQLKELVDGPVIDFAHYGRVQTEWTESADGFLAIDRDGDASITIDELFGDVTATEDGLVAGDGFEALAAYDQPSRGGNGDGVIDSEDEIFGALRVWRDRDGDGRTDAGENLSLGEHGILAVDLDWKRVRFDDGRDHEARDVWFQHNRL